MDEDEDGIPMDEDDEDVQSNLSGAHAAPALPPSARKDTGKL